MVRFFLVLLSLFFFTSLSSQDLRNYNGLYSSGKLPSVLTQSTFLKVSESIGEAVSEQESRVIKKAKKEFVLNANYILDELLSSGRIVYNDTISNYLNKVKTVILKDNPELQKKIKIYVFKTPVVNALATSEGIIFVTTGLLARLNIEAELAFILSHEIEHYLKKHSLNAYVERINLSRNSSEFRSLGLDEKYKLLASKSREVELEADREGLVLFQKTNYNHEAPASVFEILRKSSLPYSSMKYDHSFFTIGGVDIPDSAYTTYKADTNSVANDTNVVFSTHPAIDERIKTSREDNKKANYKGDKDYIVSADWFKLSKAISRVELVRQYADLGAFDIALYHSFLVWKEFPDCKYNAKMKARILYEFTAIREKITNLEFNKDFGFDPLTMNQRELVSLAFLSIVEAEKNDPADSYYLLVKESLATLYKKSESLERNRYSSLMDGNPVVGKMLLQSKIDAVREAYSFDEYNSKKERRKYVKRVSKRGLGIDSMLIIEPHWEYYDTRKGNHFIHSEKQAGIYSSLLVQNAELAGLHINIFSAKQMTEEDVEKFNELVLLKDYLSYVISTSRYGLVYVDVDKVEQITKKYHTGKIALMGVNTTLIKKHFIEIGGYVLGSVVVFFTAPILLYLAFAPDYSTEFVTVVLDVNRNKVEFVDQFKMKAKSRESLLHSRSYDYFRMFKKENKSSK